MELSYGIWCQLARLREQTKWIERNHRGDRRQPLEKGASLHSVTHRTEILTDGCYY
jgi:hypothetical protein